MFLFYFIIILYLFFIIWLLNGYKNVIKEDKINSDFTPFVSVIIAAKNEEKNLETLFEFLLSQIYRNYEIIVVNDKSSDDSESILKQFSKQHNNISYITIENTPKEWSSKKWAIYNGILAAKGEIIIQTDADCYMSNKWISLMVNPFDNHEVGFVSSLTPTFYPQNNLFRHLFLMDSIAQDMFSGYSIGQELTISCNARSIAYRKKYFLEINGYNDINHIESGDDDLLLQKFSTLSDGKIKFIFNFNAIVVSDPPKSIKEFLNQRIR